MPLAAWKIEARGPVRLAAGDVGFERNLEDWIAADPGLIDRSLVVVQRQLRVDGGWLDLLAVDAQGRATVIEIKRRRLIRETIAQAIDYASSIATMPLPRLRNEIESYLSALPSDHHGLSVLLDASGEDSRRDVAIVVVGVGQEPGLDRVIEHLHHTGMSIRAVTFDVFALDDGTRVLVREETEAAEPPVSVTESAEVRLRAVLERAGGPESVNGRRMMTIVRAADRNGLYAKPYKWSVMLAPPQHHNRALVTLWRWSDRDELAIQYWADAFAEFFSITADAVREILGPDNVRVPVATDEDAQKWAGAIDSLFEAMEAEATLDVRASAGPDSVA